MSLSDYLSEHWSMLVPLIGMSILLITDIHLERQMIRRIAVTTGLLFLYSVFCYIETYLGNQSEYSIFRSILSATNYSLIDFILVEIIMIVYREKRFFVLIPAILNAIICFISIPTGIVFSFDENNFFHRGPLGHIAYIVCGIYLIYFIFRMFTKGKRQKEEYPLLVFLFLTATLCLIIPLFLYAPVMHWFVSTIAIDILLYYVYLLQRYTKRDPLTKLLNRQSYYSDTEKYFDYITSVITIDMNGLKEINDNQGHVAGDVALKALGDCFYKAARSGQRVYRIGGDEFVLVCLNSSEDDVKSLIERIRNEVSQTAYTCSIGYAMQTGNCTIDNLYHEADKRLYEEKKAFYERTGKDRRKR